MYEKFKSLMADDGIFMVLLLLLVGVVSFGLGRQSVEEGVQNTSIISPGGVVFSQENTVLPEVVPINDEATSVQVVGSRSGSKYHLPDCPGAKQMKEENKIYFDSILLAEAAGYTPAANCPGL